MRNLFSSAVMAAGLVLFASALPAEAAGSPQITVSQIAIVAGKLVITGNDTSVGKVITIQGTTVHTTSAGPQKAFAFNINYRTNDCRLTLVTDTGSLDNLIIGNCAPGFTAKGAWAAATQYALNDVVTRFGQTYRPGTRVSPRRPNRTPQTGNCSPPRG
jgi:hypothetical protein